MLPRLPKLFAFEFRQSQRDRLRQHFKPRLERLEDRLAPAAWNPLGPAPIMDPNNVSGEGAQAYAGRLTGLAADPTDANTIYIAAAGGGVWKTANGGTTWIPLTDSQSTLFMGSIAVAPGSDINHRVIYAGTGEASFAGDSYYGRGVLVSKDSGNTWTLTGNSVFDRSSIGKVVIDPTDPTGNTAYAAVSGVPANGFHNGSTDNYGIWKTTNGGTTWTNTTSGVVDPLGFNPFTDLVMDPGNHDILFAAVGDISGGSSSNGVYETIDGGITWTPLASFPGGTGTGRIALAIADVGMVPTLYASVSDPNSTNFGATLEIEKSTNAGLTWTAVMTESSANYVDYMGTQGWYDQTLIIDPKDATGNTVYAAGQADPSVYPLGGIIKTTNGGTTWTDITLSSDGTQPHVDHHAIGFDANGRLLDSNDGGIWRLDNPKVGSIQWTDLNGNLQITQFTGIALDPTNPNIAFGGSQDNGTEKYTGSSSWNLVFGGDGGFIRVDPNNPQHVYTENFGISLARSDDGGNTFTPVNNSAILGKAPTGSPLQPNFYLPYVLDPQNTNRVVLATDYVNQSLNNGDTWTAIGTPGVGGFNTNVDGVTALAVLGNTIYAATTDGNVWVTTNNGTSWARSDPIPSYVPPFFGYQDLEIDTSDTTGRTAYIVTANFSQDIDGTTSGHNHIFKTTNAGASWTDISGNLPNLPVWSIAINHADNTLYAGTDNGVYATTNGGTSWSPFGTGMPNAQVVSLEYSPTLHVLAAGTHGRGAFEIATAQALTVTPPPNQTTDEGGPSSFSLGFFSDPNPTATSWTVDINWGDGSSDAVFTTNKQGALGSTTHPYAEEGSYTLTVQVTNNNNMSDSMTSSVTIFDTPVEVSLVAFPAVEGKALINQALATFTDPGGAELSGGISSHYTATIVWGDFTPPTAGTITFSNGVFTVSGSHTYAEEGSYPVTVLIDHEGVFTNSGTALISPLGNPSFETGDFTYWTTSSTFGPGGQFFSTPEVVGAGVTAGFGFFATAPTGGNFAAFEGFDGDGPGTASIAQDIDILNDRAATLEFDYRAAWDMLDFAGSTKPRTFMVDIEPFGGGTPLLSIPVLTALPGTKNLDTGNVHFAVDLSQFVGQSIRIALDIFVPESSTGPGQLEIDDVFLWQSPTAPAVPVSDPAVVVSANNLTAVEGKALNNQVVATFTDPAGAEATSDYTAMINWGDNTPASSGTISFNNGLFTVTGSHYYSEEGNYATGVTISHDAAPPTAVSGSAMVSDPAVVATAVNFTASVGTALNGQAVATFTDPAGAELTSDYSATINWGDNTTTPGTISLSNGVFTVSGNHTYSAIGTLQTKVTISHDSAPTTMVTGSVTVQTLVVTAPADQTATEGASSSFTLGSFSDPNAGANSWTVDVKWGDGVDTTFTTTSQGTLTSKPHTYAEEGPYTVTVMVTDNSNLSGSTTYQVTVSDPAVSATPTSLTAIEGAAFSNQAVATFTDPAGAEGVGDYTATINWGDNSPTTTGTITPSNSVFTVTGSHSYSEEGTFPISVTINHDSASSTTVSSTATVSDPGVAATAVNFTASVGTALNNQAVATFTDPAGAELTSDYSATIYWGDNTTTAGTITPNNGVFTVSGNHTYSTTGTLQTKVSISHDSAPATMVTGSVTIQTLVVTAPANQTATEGASSSFTLGSFSDPNAGATSWTVDVKWGDGSADTIFTTTSQGTLATKPHTYAEEGPYTVSVMVTDNNNLSGAATYQVTVSDAAVSATATSFTAVEGAAFSNQAVATFTDPAGAEATTDYAATINWGDNTPATSGTITPGNGVFTVAGSHRYSEEGPYTVSVTINHDSASSTTVSSSATVSDPGVAATAVNFTASVGTALNNQAVATFTDPAGAEVTTDYAASIDWGDGTTTTGTITLSNGVFTVSGNHTYSATSTLQTKVTISHDNAPTTMVSGSVTIQTLVVTAPANQTATEGASSSFNLGSFSDPNASANSWTVDVKWGDGVDTSFTTSSQGSLGSMAHAYTEEGSYTLTVTVTDNINQSGSATSQVAVSDPAVSATANSLTAVEGAAFSNQAVATFTDPAGAESVGDYAATINWGDNTPATSGTITLSNGVFTVTGGHRYSEEGPYTVSVTINHDSASSTTVSSTATVSDPAVLGTPVSVSAIAGAPFSGAVATFTDPGVAEANDGSHYSASINWGDNTTTAGTITLSNGVFTVSGNHTYAAAGSFTITTALNHEGVVTTVLSPATVGNVLGVTPPANQTAAEGMSSSLPLGSFSDPNASANSWTVDINWGDKSADTTFTTTSQGSLGSKAHAYVEEGTYTVTVTVTDNTNLSGSATYQVAASDPAVLGMSVNVKAFAGAPFSGAVATFTDPGGAEANDGTHYSAMINWGDNTPATAGTIAFSGGVFTVSGNHTYAAAGLFTVTSTLSHEGVLATVQSPAGITGLGIAVQPQLMGNIAFWQSVQGQALIRSFGLTASGLTLGQWLATTFPNLYGGGNGAGNLRNASNAQVAAFYMNLFDTQSLKLNAEVMATALNVFATTASLGGTTAQPYGFMVNALGLGAYSWNIGFSGPAFGVPNNSTLNVYQLLLAANNFAIGGDAWDAQLTLHIMALSVFDTINGAGGIR